MRVVIALIVLAGCDTLLFRKPDQALLPDAPADVDCASVMPDEDGDCVTDLEDNCPGVANPAQTNVLDRDEVGDDCDPNPTIDDDRIALFQGFSDVAKAMEMWPDEEQNASGQWSFVPGHADHTVFDDIELLEYRMPVMSSGVTIEAGFEHIEFQDANSMPTMGVYLDNSLGVPDGHHCWVEHLYQAPDVRLAVQETAGGRIAPSSIPTIAAGARFVIRMTRQNGATDATHDHISCNITVGTAAQSGTQRIQRSMTVWSTDPANRFIKVGGRYTTTKVHWITVYTTTALID